MLAEPRHRRLLPYVELAKILEHKTKDRMGALALIDEALDLVRRGLTRAGPEGGALSLAALEHRRQRLAGTNIDDRAIPDPRRG